MIRKTRAISLMSVPLLVLAVLPASQRAFSNVDIGGKVKNAALPTLAGDKESFLGDGGEDVHFFFFFNPDQERSLVFMRELAALHGELKDRSIHWSAIVSDRHPTDQIRTAVTESGLPIPVLLDRSDRLFGELGVALYPVVGMTDRDHVLRAYLHYRKVNFLQLVRAHILHMLGDISDDELAGVVDPKAAVQGGDSVAARRLLKLAQMLFKAGKYDMALTRTNESIENDPALVPAYLLLGKIQLERQDKQAAAQAFKKALEITPDNEEAQQGLHLCAEHD